MSTPIFIAADWTEKTLHHMIYVFSLQEEDEQRTERTTHKNRRGFTAVDAAICSSILIQVFRKQKVSQKQFDILIKKESKYHKQIPPQSFCAKTFRDEWIQKNTEPEDGYLILDD